MDTEIENSISLLLQQKHYPCVAAIQSFLKKDYKVGVYEDFGAGIHSYQLGKSLLQFRDQQQQTQSPFMSFWAVYKDRNGLSEELFEENLWKELSFLTSFPEFAGSWDPQFSQNPQDKNFCFSLDGSAFFVVGLHPQSPRLARRFPFPALVFNLYDQFRTLMTTNEFANMVATNRRREKLYQGDLNPMVEKYGEDWEAIQFSGRNNPPEWQCPFQFGLQRERQL